MHKTRKDTDFAWMTRFGMFEFRWFDTDVPLRLSAERVWYTSGSKEYVGIYVAYIGRFCFAYHTIPPEG